MYEKYLKDSKVPIDELNARRPDGYFDREGNEIGLGTWAALIETDYRIVAQTVIGKYKISTVWLGMNHRFGPLLFETMVFPGNACVRYSTEAEARAGHEVAVLGYR